MIRIKLIYCQSYSLYSKRLPIHKNKIKSILLDSWWQPEGFYEIQSVHQSVLLSVGPGIFMVLDHQFFANFSMMLETCTQVCNTRLDFLEKKNCPQNWVKRGPKIFFEIIELINFFLKFSFMKVYTVCCVSMQILCRVATCVIGRAGICQALEVTF